MFNANVWSLNGCMIFFLITLFLSLHISHDQLQLEWKGCHSLPYIPALFSCITAILHPHVTLKSIWSAIIKGCFSFLDSAERSEEKEKGRLLTVMMVGCLETTSFCQKTVETGQITAALKQHWSKKNYIIEAQMSCSFCISKSNSVDKLRTL